MTITLIDGTNITVTDKAVLASFQSGNGAYVESGGVTYWIPITAVVKIQM